jgi:hypothetical protein
MNCDPSVFNLRYERRLWLGTFESSFGPLDIVFEGKPDAPDPAKVEALLAFLPKATEIIERLRNRLPFPFLWHPIRITPNFHNRIGVQFRHRVLDRLELLHEDGA